MATDFNNVYIDSSWSLFLDRDGVINTRLINDYVKSIDELEINPEFLNVYPFFRKTFHRVFIVTNQRGIATGLMTREDLQKIHNHLEAILEKSGGKPDKIYFCPHDKNSCECRKPKTGMANFAKADFPEIEFTKSVIIGDSESDMLFGKNAGMLTVMYPENEKHYGDLSFRQFMDILNSKHI